MKNRIMAVVGICTAAAVVGALAAFHLPVAVGASIQDQAAVYDAVLASWVDKEQSHQLIDERLGKGPSRADPDFRECAKGVDFSTEGDVRQNASLAGVPLQTKGIEIIDGSKWTPADPGQAIANGQAVDSAVKEGFSHSLISLSQIAFSRDGKDALVKFGMTCGSLCGSGATIHLHKCATQWGIVDRCGRWIS